MPALIRPNSVKVLTQDGEIKVSLTLDLNINLNSNEIVSTQSFETNKTIEKKEEKTEWAIPDFESLPTVNFGKKL